MNRLVRVTWLCMATLMLQPVPARGADGLFNEDGYRAGLYRSPTPLEHEDAQVLEPEGLLQLLREQPGVVLIDAYRNPWLHGRYTLPEEHRNLPGSLWLANCGDGNLSSDWERHCREALQQATRGNRAHPLVFYCRSDCWLGWNAAKRAASWGYSRLYWLRDGIEAWEQAGQTLEPSQPVPYAGSQQEF
ncbi:PQQ-dependent catabolism-associated CXXCW motif protein [Thiopseudomonas denitrificans]|uniref:PQQ-dependent catabolism-associated CXXCW motif protein n=2 Tax=Thiopseudomonas denitrificans TaxID=1501432 RepID=A0A4R6TV84_9GAMM|nr:PQQ-dependent catabolism-associated CXXCW motif protein [Thiopseudomonas denitrificans]